LEDRLEDDQSGNVQYTERQENMLRLAIPLEAASNLAEVEAWNTSKTEQEAAGSKVDFDKAVVPFVPQSVLLEAYAAAGQISDYTSPVTKQKGSATTSTRFLTFPKFLVVHLRREVIGAGWVPKKLDCEVPMGDLDLEHLRKASPGLQPGEKAAPADGEAAAPQFDETVVNDLVGMGFPLEACKKAVVNTGNKGAEAASEWLMMHMEDPDFAEPMQAPSTGGAAPVDAASVEMLMSMGFGKAVCEKALRSTGGDVERATDWIFSHPEDDGSEEPAAAVEAEDPAADGPGNYELVGIISHLGKSTSCGHYVCHIKKDGQWAFFNDEKVCKSDSPPFNHGYLYLYRRR